jgi:hypothetical protein
MDASTMTTDRKRHGWIWAALSVVLLGVYVVGYFWGSDYIGGGTSHTRRFSRQWMAEVYRPVGYFECKWRRNRVLLQSEDDGPTISINP